jgi:ABC-type amino acid transport substrate-binding protein
MLKLFEKQLNKKLKTKHLVVHVIIIPTVRDRLIPSLVEGLGDIAAGNLTITDDRLKSVDFSDPMLKGINEILVTGPESPKVNILSDLSNQTIHVRKSSSYYESLVRLNKQLSKEGKAPVKIVEANEYLEDEDLLEMVNAGLIPIPATRVNFGHRFLITLPFIRKLSSGKTVRSPGPCARIHRC